jgi:hypothetical protein
MGVPTLVSSTPVTGAVNVDRNVAISLVFSEAMDEATMVSALVQLKHIELDEILEADLSLSTDGLTLTITPARLLIANASYQLMVVGTNTAGALGAVKSATGSEMAITQLVTFLVGDEIDTTGLAKTPEQAAQEGDLDLPSDVVVSPSVFAVSSTNPANHKWNVALTKETVVVTFNDTVDPDLVDTESFDLQIFPFHEEAEHFAVDRTGAAPDFDVCPIFEFEGLTSHHADAGGGLLDYTAPTGAIVVTGNQIIWTKQTDKPFPYNACIEVTLDGLLASTGGNTLGRDKRFAFYTTPWPNWVSPRAIRSEMYPVDLSAYPDDLIGLMIWSNSMMVGHVIRWATNLKLPSRAIKELVKCETIADLFRALTAIKGILQGQFKRLGDFEVEYRHPTASSADVKPFKLLEAEKCIKELRDRLTRYWNRPRAFVKGRYAVHERPDYRRRLWRTSLGNTDSTKVVEDMPGANLATERLGGTPGALDTWS